jgi:hypothetical protein
MSARLLRPRSSGFHPDAQDWRNRVITNGGTVSGSTLTAVSNFCRSIDAAGLRDRFYRLNLFCGTELSACLVPLYRGPSLAGTQYGNLTDTNNNFVSGDYVETGTGGGLTRTSGAKTLSTGLTPANAPQFATGHIATSVVNGSIVLFGTALDYGSSGGVRAQHVVNGTAANAQLFRTFDDSVQTSGPAGANGVYSRWVVSRTSSTSAVVYRNAASYLTRTTTANQPSSTGQLTIFTGGNFGLHYYSLGDGMTNSQVSAFDSALAAFLTALGRT